MYLHEWSQHVREAVSPGHYTTTRAPHSASSATRLASPAAEAAGAVAGVAGAAGMRDVATLSAGAPIHRDARRRRWPGRRRDGRGCRTKLTFERVGRLSVVLDGAPLVYLWVHLMVGEGGFKNTIQNLFNEQTTDGFIFYTKIKEINIY